MAAAFGVIGGLAERGFRSVRGAVPAGTDAAEPLEGNAQHAIDDETAIRVVDGAAQVVSEGQWKLFQP